MRNERAAAAARSRTAAICANEGCGRPAEGALCDRCALEWALFHRDERREICGAGAPPVLAARLFGRSE